MVRDHATCPLQQHRILGSLLSPTNKSDAMSTSFVCSDILAWVGTELGTVPSHARARSRRRLLYARATDPVFCYGVPLGVENSRGAGGFLTGEGATFLICRCNVFTCWVSSSILLWVLRAKPTIAKIRLAKIANSNTIRFHCWPNHCTDELEFTQANIATMI